MHTSQRMIAAFPLLGRRPGGGGGPRRRRDPDLLFAQFTRPPRVLLNDGGWFTEIPDPVELPPDVVIEALTVAELDGDGLPDRLLRRAPGDPASGDPQELAADALGSTALLATLSDVDGDGVLDVWVPQDLGLPGLLFHLDPAGDAAVERGRDLGLDLEASAMGFDASDLDGDGRLDLCLSDLGPPRCLLSDGAGASLGIDAG